MAERGSEGPLRVIASKPELYSDLVQFFEAFQRLSSCRPVGMTGPGAIPWTAIDQYASRYEFEGQEFDRLVHFVEVLDGVFLASLQKSGTPGRGRKP